MLTWFEKEAPIKTKFKVLLGIHATLATIGFAATSMAVTQSGISPTLIIVMAGAVVCATILTVVMATDRICRPYVNTVMRMESLAAGDLDSQIRYTDYTDCVGRMTKAMVTFRNNAIEIKQSREAQEQIVSELSKGLKKLAGNELDYHITNTFPPAYDELRTDFNGALQALSSTIVAVREGASGVLGGANEIRAASNDLALRNEQQAASLEETAAAMNQVTGSVKETANSAADVQRSITEAHVEATEGGQIVQKAIAAMAAIEKSAQDISQIINVIDGIAFQTNLLALNAGVEAARAGDAGKGFAVVANEVRALAQRSADAAKDIKELITTSSEQVGDGVALVGETGGVLEKIVARVGESSKLIKMIAELAESQATNLQQVNSAVGEMDRMTQQNAAMVEQSTAASRSLADEANELTNLVTRFRTGGVTSPRNTAIAPRNTASAPRVTAIAPRNINTSPKKRQNTRPAPATRGNLAVKPVENDDDWTEF